MGRLIPLYHYDAEVNYQDGGSYPSIYYAEIYSSTFNNVRFVEED